MNEEKTAATKGTWKHIEIRELFADVYCIAEEVDEKVIKNMLCSVLELHVYDWCLQHSQAYHVHLKVRRHITDLL